MKPKTLPDKVNVSIQITAGEAADLEKIRAKDFPAAKKSAVVAYAFREWMARRKTA
jgi:hypothetical protein